MADKTITDLQLADAFTADLSLPVDDGIQTYRATGAQVKAFLQKAPTVQKFSSGSGTYTTPVNPAPLYIRVMLVGGGAGGNTDGSITQGSDGNDSTFGSVITAEKGLAGIIGGGNGGVGGSFTLSGGVIDINSQDGGPGGPADGQTTGHGLGGAGGSNPNATSMPSTASNANGLSAPAGSGSGGSGAGSNLGTTVSGEAGGAGGYVYAQINNPDATYAYVLGAGGAGAPAGGGASYAGGDGGSGGLIVEEYYI